MIATSHSVPRGDWFCRHGQEEHTPRDAEGGGPPGGHWVGGKGGAALPGSPNISQPVGSVCSVNSGGVCDSCEVTCLLIVHSESCEAPFSLYGYKPHTVRWIHHKGTTQRGTGQSLLCSVPSQT